jgi:hypothetical protein
MGNHMAEMKTNSESREFAEKIASQILGTPFEIQSCEYSSGCFGNAVIVLSEKGKSHDMKFIVDRGDIYIQEKKGRISKWIFRGCYSHESDESSIVRLLKAIREFTKSP